jgi:GNAT superfamily N-acetyltransferase
VKRALPGGFELDDDPARVDVEAVHRFLSEESYWARARTRDQLDALIAASDRLVGLYAAEGQVGFSRAVRCHGAGLVYLADLYVLQQFRGRGLGVELVRFSVEEGPLAGLRWILHTDDAHSLYAKFGFGPSPRLLERPAR